MNIEERINRLIDEMTVDEKIGQLNLIECDPSRLDEIKESIAKGEAGSIILALTPLAGEEKMNMVDRMRVDELQKTAVEKSPHGIPLLFGRDVIHGFGIMMPVPLAFSASFNMDLIRKCYEYTGQYAAASGVNWVYAPMLDCARDPRWGRMVEGPGEDPYLGSRVAEAVVRGFQRDDLKNENSVAACAKHYIGYGASEGGRDYHNADISDYTLRNYYLPAFKAAVGAGLKTVMSSFNEIGGQPVTSSRYLLTDVLRGELGFDGLVVSDWEAVMQLKMQGTAENDVQACAQALNAGLEIDMVSNIYLKNIKKAIKEGMVCEETLNEAVRRVLRVKFECGLFENPYSSAEVPDLDGFAAAAQQLAEESMVLLKNKNNALPIDRSEKIALIGPLAEEKRALIGTWSMDGQTKLVRSFRECFEEVFDDVITAPSHMLDDQARCMRDADTIIIAVGESQNMSGEANSVASLEIGEGQKELIRRAHETGKKVIVLMACARPTAMQSIEPYADAVLYTWHAGTKTADAAAAIVTGRVCPSGHLPVTFPAVTGQVPVYYNAPHPARDWAEGYYLGCPQGNYRDTNGMYMYPFGYGLSYTDFEYENINISDTAVSLEDLKNGRKIKISVTVKNTGNYDGKAAAQLYITDCAASMTRPMRELKGFEKVFLKKNESRELVFEIGFDELAFYNADRKFEAEKGSFRIYIGNDCLAELSAGFEII